MFLRVVCLCTVSAMALHSALCAESFCERENLEEESALILGSTFEEEIDLTRVEALYGESDMAADNWDCCGKEACSTLSWSVTAKPIYWLNSHQGEPIGQRLVSQRSRDLSYKNVPVQTDAKVVNGKAEVSPPTTKRREGIGEDRPLGMVGRLYGTKGSSAQQVTSITLGEALGRRSGEFVSNAASHIEEYLANWTPAEMVHLPIYWGWGGSAELVGETEDGIQHSFAFVGFYGKKNWEVGAEGGNLDFTILPTYLSATPFLPVPGIRIKEDGRGLVYFDSLSLTEKNWVCQGRWTTGVKGFITPSVEMGGRFGFSGLYSTWDRDGSARDQALDPFSGSGGGDNTVVFTQNNEVYGGGATLGVAFSAGFGCGCSLYGEGAATLYLAQEKASRDIQYSLLRYKETLVGIQPWPVQKSDDPNVKPVDYPDTILQQSPDPTKGVSQYKAKILDVLDLNSRAYKDYLITVFNGVEDNDESINPSPPVPNISFLFPKMWKVFPEFSLNVGVEWNCGGECNAFALRVGWEQHFLANMFTDFVVKDGAYPESYRNKDKLEIKTDAQGQYVLLSELELQGDELSHRETMESVCVQEYRAISTSYFFGGPTVSITMFF